MQLTVPVSATAGLSMKVIQARDALQTLADSFGNGATIGRRETQIDYKLHGMDPSGSSNVQIAYEGERIKLNEYQEVMGDLEDRIDRVVSMSASINDEATGILTDLVSGLQAALPSTPSPAEEQLALDQIDTAVARAAQAVDDAVARHNLNAGTIVDPIPPPSTPPPGDLQQWIEEATQILRSSGYSLSEKDANDIRELVMHESSGDPYATNLWDINAQEGHPSKGLTQTIDSTFDQWSAVGHRDIWSPPDNIAAGVRYGIETYGSVAEIPGIKALNEGGQYHGY